TGSIRLRPIRDSTEKTGLFSRGAAGSPSLTAAVTSAPRADAGTGAWPSDGRAAPTAGSDRFDRRTTRTPRAGDPRTNSGASTAPGPPSRFRAVGHRPGRAWLP